jgi:predicted RNA-binding protein with PUA-like domain
MMSRSAHREACINPTKHCVAVTAPLRPVTLAEIKANPKLKDMVLARVSRLSVQPVTSQEWSIICKLGGLADPPQA